MSIVARFYNNTASRKQDNKLNKKAANGEKCENAMVMQ